MPRRRRPRRRFPRPVNGHPVSVQAQSNGPEWQEALKRLVRLWVDPRMCPPGAVGRSQQVSVNHVVACVVRCHDAQDAALLAEAFEVLVQRHTAPRSPQPDVVPEFVVTLDVSVTAAEIDRWKRLGYDVRLKDLESVK